MMRSTARLFAVSSAALASLAGAARGDEVPRSAFTASAIHIDFDGLAGGSTITTGEIITTQYAAQGVTFNNPDLLTRANSFLAQFLATNSDPNIAFVDQGGGGTPGIRPQEIIFSTPQLRVGCFFATSADCTIKLEAFNGATSLEQIVKSGQPLGSFGLEGFVGIQRSEGITMVKLSSAGGTPDPFNFSFDDVLFESGGSSCYANCDGSTTAPILNVADFSCFLTKYASGDPYANCDASTTAPILNVQDFSCFLTKYASGCP